MADVPRDYLMAAPLLMRSALDKCVYTLVVSMFCLCYHFTKRRWLAP